ncbi:hypothetical protein I4U23_005011 [Adineta vaga]|nr:hypothetical protein I4U23_005011 [Adineta vaga]
MVLSLVIVICIVIVIGTGSLYLLKYFIRHRHSYMNIEQFCELAHQHEQCSTNDEDGVTSVIEEMFNESPFYKANHVRSNLDYIHLYKYLREFCCQKSLYTNRQGPVCPFLPRAFKEQSIYFFDDIYSETKQELIEIVRQCRNDYLSVLKPIEFENRSLIVYKTLIILIRNTSISHEIVDQIQMELKSEFILKYGLMLGEFHLSSNSSAIKNKDFYPLRTKTPLLVIRRLVANDIIFLNQKDRYSKDIRSKMIKMYIDLDKNGLLHSRKDHYLRTAHELLHELNNNDE